MKLERTGRWIVSATGVLVLSPFVWALTLSIWHYAGGGLSVVGTVILPLLLNVAIFLLTVWKSGPFLHGFFNACRRLPEPFCLSIELGSLGACLFGGVMLADILLLGHARPAGWELDRIPLVGLLGFTVFFTAGLLVGLLKRRRDGAARRSS
jgi:hypothetical protein